MTSICVIAPLYNEAENLAQLHERLCSVLERIELDYTILYVNDGSTDSSAAIAQGYCETSDRVSLLELSRNFGKEVAISAGLDHAEADAVVVIDSDLQDPPELIADLVNKWQEGFDVVYGTRLSRSGESWLKRSTASGFYRLLNAMVRVRIPEDTGDFRLLSRRAVLALRQFREHHRFMKGLFSWIGYSQTAIYYDRDARHAGSTKWSYWKLWSFALEGITSFTSAPLKFSTYFGSFVAFAAVIYGLIIFCRTLILGIDVPGYASLMVAILFLGGVQLLVLGVLGEYVGRIFNESKQRPLYFVEREIKAKNAAEEK